MTSQPSRRFHEAGVGSRTGLRLSLVERDRDGFEDLEAFYKASEAALDHRQQQPDHEQEEDGDDYDSYDETHFSRRLSSSVARGRDSAAASSSMMDIQNSSAPSPRSLLRSSRGSAVAGPSSSPYRKGRSNGNITLADDDDDLDLPNLSTGSRSFDLMTMGHDQDEANDATLRAPPSPRVLDRGFPARRKDALPSTNAKGKGRSQPTLNRVELSDSEDDRILASIQQRLESAYDDDEDYDQDLGIMDDDEIIPVRPSPLKTPSIPPAPKPRSPKRPSATRKRQDARAAIPIEAAPPPKRKQPAPSKPRAPEPEPEPVSVYGFDEDEAELDYLPYQSPSPAREPAAPPKKKRGRPPKNASAEPEPYRESAPTRPSQRSKATGNGIGRAAASSSKAKPASKSKKAAGEVVERVRSQPREATVYDENGVRRSTRQRFAPLEYWRGERIRYGRPSLPTGQTAADLRRAEGDEFEDDPSMMLMRKRVPVLDVKEVIRIPRAPGEGTFAGTTRTRTTSRPKTDRKSEERTPRLNSQTPDPLQTPEPQDEWYQLDPTADTMQPEDGWDNDTFEDGVVIDDEEETEIVTSVVRTKASLQPIAHANQEFRFEKLFNCNGLMATGVLHLPAGTRKPTKPSQDNTFVFCVLQGALRATVHRKSFIVGPHGIFQVPSGNTYSLENICQRDVQLFFAQCRKTKKAHAGDLTTFTQMSDTSHTPRALLRGLSDRYVDRDARELRDQERYFEQQRAREEHEVREEEYVQPRSSSNQAKQRSAQVSAPIYTTDSDAELSDADDFEPSRQVKTKKKRKLRRM